MLLRREPAAFAPRSFLFMIRLRLFCCVSSLLFAAVPVVRADSVPLFRDTMQPVEARVADLLGRLTLDEKIALCHGATYWSNSGVPRLGVPKMIVSDGPHGVHEERLEHGWTAIGRTDDFVTDLPCGFALAATWNSELAHAYGGVLGAEARARGKDVILGPGINIARTPLFGRNFEFTGEDPFLTARLAVGYIRGVQAEGVAACVKHFAANNQEIGARDGIDVQIDRRTLHEIYLPGFRAAVQEAGVLTVMGAYNRVNGSFACEQDYLLNTVLKRDWGFTGLVMSDWGGAHSTLGCALHGLDLEMNGRSKRDYDQMFFGAPLLEAIRGGSVNEAVLDDKIRRILRVMIRIGVLDAHRLVGSVNTSEHQVIARRVAEEAIMLLKNADGLLPLEASRLGSVAVIGANATRKHSPAGGGLPGGGSSAVKPLYEITPLEALVAKLGARVSLTYAVGYSADEAESTHLREQAVAVARGADAVIFIGGLSHEQETETKDRLGFALPGQQAELLAALLAVNPRTVVVLVAGAAPDMSSWVQQASALVLAPYNGSEAGTALANVLLGETNPSGKLPITLARSLSDYAPHAGGDPKHYPGRDGKVYYDEGVFVGYRFFDARQIEPLFCFGHGLSYTQFHYDKLRITPENDAGEFTIHFQLRNVGPRAGAETAQVYVAPKNPPVPRPVRELKGFAKVFLQPGETKDVSVTLRSDAFSFYDADRSEWVRRAGAFMIEVGASSRDLRLVVPLSLP